MVSDRPARRLVQGEARTEWVFGEYRSLLFSVAYRVLGSAADAEDAVQDAWVKWSGADRSQVADPKAYLVRIVSNLTLDRLPVGQGKGGRPTSVPGCPSRSARGATCGPGDVLRGRDWR